MHQTMTMCRGTKLDRQAGRQDRQAGRQDRQALRYKNLEHVRLNELDLYYPTPPLELLKLSHAVDLKIGRFL